MKPPTPIENNGSNSVNTEQYEIGSFIIIWVKFILNIFQNLRDFTVPLNFDINLASKPSGSRPALTDSYQEI